MDVAICTATERAALEHCKVACLLSSCRFRRSTTRQPARQWIRSSVPKCWPLPTPRRSLCQGRVRTAAGPVIFQQQLLDSDAFTDTSSATTQALRPVLDLSEGLEAPVQLLYLLTLLGFLVVGAWLVVRQVLVRRELEEAAKVLGERTRAGDATSEDNFELGVILLRKKLYTQAVKNLDKARRSWNGLPDELAQVHNALGFAYFNMEKNDLAVDNYRKAVELQPGYVTAWNNLGDAFERKKSYSDALKAYEEALSYAPSNKVAKSRSDTLRSRLQSSSSTS